jgi:hypothetical protein
MHPDCEECQRLWHNYSAATTDHIRLDSKLRLAALERDYGQIERLTPDVEAAERKRNNLREAIASHDRSAHTKATNA